ncbi:MAG: outer membrane homotrimeric porin [Desulfovibrio sp.]|nr:outer membrane homotrimeric porin [Desulfovibrio sp.]
MKKLKFCVWGAILLCESVVLLHGLAFAGPDFKVRGEWIVGFALGDGNLARKSNGHNLTVNDDRFGASQRIRLQLDAIASENLFGKVFFEIGNQTWGQNATGGALGADGVVVEIKQAYLDWIVPDTDLKLRMGLQPITLPNGAGGSAVLDTDAAAIVANYQFNDNIDLTMSWIRPLNDNFAGWTYGNTPTRYGAHYLDNLDLFSLALPLNFDGISLTPWIMYGILGEYALNGFGGEEHFQHNSASRNFNQPAWYTKHGEFGTSLTNWHNAFSTVNGGKLGETSRSYSSMFWAGLPIKISFWDPLNIELDLNYGFVESMGRFDVRKRNSVVQRASSQREGWVVKALIEYKMDWGVPGLFGWYASGDDGNIKNGSERIPSVLGRATFTTFSGYGGIDWAAKRGMAEWRADYSGTWGIGLQLRDVSLLEDLNHTFRAVWWGGTNSLDMIKYMKCCSAWNEGGSENPYLTTLDNMLEFNLDTKWKLYENLSLHLDLGYIVNMIDTDSWRRSWMEEESLDMEKQDAWKAQLSFVYSF